MNTHPMTGAVLQQPTPPPPRRFAVFDRGQPCVEHSTAYSGQVPCTGDLRCRLCGTAWDEQGNVLPGPVSDACARGECGDCAGRPDGRPCEHPCHYQQPGEYQDYRVAWWIDVSATSPRHAAQEAQRIQRDRGSWASQFDVTGEDGVIVKVDLDDPENPDV